AGELSLQFSVKQLCKPWVKPSIRRELPRIDEFLAEFGSLKAACDTAGVHALDADPMIQAMQAAAEWAAMESRDGLTLTKDAFLEYRRLESIEYSVCHIAHVFGSWTIGCQEAGLGDARHFACERAMLTMEEDSEPKEVTKYSNAQLLVMYRETLSTVVLSRKLGCSHENIRIRLNKCSTPLERKAIKEHAKVTGIVDDFKRTEDVYAVAKENYLSVRAVVEILQTQGIRPPREYKAKKRHIRNITYHDSEILQCLREAARFNGAKQLLIGQYDRFAKGRTLENGRRYPTKQAVLHHMGTWTDACAAIGVDPGKIHVSTGITKYTEDELRDAIREFLRWMGTQHVLTKPTVRLYTEWRSDLLEGDPKLQLPSLSTIRNHFRQKDMSWSEVLSSVHGSV
ncbi:hypothetical protein CYMTET_40142, partial [Cymbomonas tetramitiformis]